MTIQITNVSPVINEIPENNGNKKGEVNLKTGQTAGDEVNISEGANFIGNLKSSIDTASKSNSAKLDAIKQQAASGKYAESSKIAEGLLKNLGVTNEII